MHKELIELLTLYPNAIALVMVPKEWGWAVWFMNEPVNMSPRCTILTKEQFFSRIEHAHHIGVVIEVDNAEIPAPYQRNCSFGYTWIYI